MAIDPNRVSSLLNYLPAIFQEDRYPSDQKGIQPNFLGRFLLGFEQLLLGLRDAQDGEIGLEQQIATIHRFFEPGASLAESERAPREFLPWLASWVAITLREDWSETRQRELIARAVELYRLRGTKRGVEEFLRIYTRLAVRVEDLVTPLQVGVHSTVGKDTYLDGGPPFYFQVLIMLPSTNPEDICLQREVARSIIELQKPAHTYYTLTIETPTFQVGIHSTVGHDTLLGKEA